MCRWLAYSGPPIYLEDLIVKPSRSLLVQSRFARENFVSDLEGVPDGAYPINGDGFGIGWYGEREEPGLYRELRPAWADENLLNLAAQIRSGLFMAHLRGAYRSSVQRTNNHPFAYRRWLFQHNGEVAGFDRIKRELHMQLRDDLYPLVRGTTDSESAFFLAITLGLEANPRAALEAMVGTVEVSREKAGIKAPAQFTCALTDGKNLYAVRYSTDRMSKSLYINSDRSGVRQLLGDETPSLPAHIVLSEPLDDFSDHWTPVPESSFVTVTEGNLEVEDFRPGA